MSLSKQTFPNGKLQYRMSYSSGSKQLPKGKRRKQNNITRFLYNNSHL